MLNRKGLWELLKTKKENRKYISLIFEANIGTNLCAPANSTLRQSVNSFAPRLPSSKYCATALQKEREKKWLQSRPKLRISIIPSNNDLLPEPIFTFVTHGKAAAILNSATSGGAILRNQQVFRINVKKSCDVTREIIHNAEMIFFLSLPCVDELFGDLLWMSQEVPINAAAGTRWSNWKMHTCSVGRMQRGKD